MATCGNIRLEIGDAESRWSTSRDTAQRENCPEVLRQGTTQGTAQGSAGELCPPKLEQNTSPPKKQPVNLGFSETAMPRTVLWGMILGYLAEECKVYAPATNLIPTGNMEHSLKRPGKMGVRIPNKGATEEYYHKSMLAAQGLWERGAGSDRNPSVSLQTDLVNSTEWQGFGLGEHA